jgi:transcriptional regulator with XRE-family HTH domain
MAIGPEKGFDGEAFYESLVSTVTARQVTWKQVSTETGVSATTLTRMAQGRRPDAASLAALGAWAGLNPAEFVTQQDSPRFAEPLAQISHLLRSDRRLNRDAAEAIDAMFRVRKASRPKCLARRSADSRVPRYATVDERLASADEFCANASYLITLLGGTRLDRLDHLVANCSREPLKLTRIDLLPPRSFKVHYSTLFHGPSLASTAA